jgi:hypothetical protein
MVSLKSQVKTGLSAIAPAPKTDSQILRDKIYSELRAIGEQAERLAHRLTVCTAWLATLPRLTMIGNGKRASGASRSLL